jgi:integrase
MARHVRSSKLENRTSRLKLPISKKAHAFTVVAPGIGLGYRRCHGPGRWVVRRSDGRGGYWIKAIALADDHEESNGNEVLTFWEAQDRARIVARGSESSSERPATVAEAIDHYAADLRSRGGDMRNVSGPRHHLSATLMARPVGLLNARELRTWRNALVKKGLAPASADRVARSLKAALTLARKDDPTRITNGDAWKDGLSRLPDSERTRNVVLDDTTIRAIVATAYDFGRDFGLLVETLAISGARTSQVLALRVEDLLEDNAGPRLMMPSSRKGRRRELTRSPLPIPSSLAAALRAASAGRLPTAPLLVGPRVPHRIFRRLAERLHLGPETSLYALRHSSITRMLIAGLPTRLVAAVHDTSVPMLERTYSRSIGAHSDALLRGALLDVKQPAAGKRPATGKRPAADNVVALKG